MVASNVQMDQMGQQEAAALAPLTQQLQQAMAAPQPQFPKIDLQSFARARPNPNNDVMQAFSNPGAILAIFGSLMTRRPMTAALKAAGAAMQGYATGNQEAYQRAEQEWHDNMDLALKQFEVERDAYSAAIQARGQSIQDKLAAIQSVGTQFHDQLLIQQAKAGNWAQIAQILDSRSSMAMQAGRLQEEMRHNRVVEDATAAQRDVANKINQQRADALTSAAGRVKVDDNQRATAGYYMRMASDMAAIKKLEQSGVDVSGYAAYLAVDDNTLLSMGAKSTLSPDQQVYLTYARDWIRAKLRKESGAAIGEKEAQTEWSTYFPTPGDDPKAIGVKQQLRDTANLAMKGMAGAALDPQAGVQAQQIINQDNADFRYFDASGAQTGAPGAAAAPAADTSSDTGVPTDY